MENNSMQICIEQFILLTSKNLVQYLQNDSRLKTSSEICWNNLKIINENEYSHLLLINLLIVTHHFE